MGCRVGKASEARYVTPYVEAADACGPTAPDGHRDLDPELLSGAWCDKKKKKKPKQRKPRAFKPDGRFVDAGFPPSAAVLTKGMRKRAIHWVRGPDIFGGAAQLFADGINAGDAQQGQIGDCWLIACMASLAEFPGQVQQLFEARQTQHNGYYRIRLFDRLARFGRQPGWVWLEIDDLIPCTKRRGKFTPVYAQPRGKELWAMLLEKAMAKLVGSYGALVGGHASIGMKCLTGKTVAVYGFRKKSKKYRKQVVLFKKQSHRAVWRARGTLKTKGQLWGYMRTACRQNCCVFVGGMRKREKKSKGLFEGHQYSVLMAQEVEGEKLVRVRNPHAEGEWRGAWSDTSQQWHTPIGRRIAAALDYRPNPKDGAFFMNFDDFTSHFTEIELTTTPMDFRRGAYQAYNEVHRSWRNDDSDSEGSDGSDCSDMSAFSSDRSDEGSSGDEDDSD